MRNRWISMCLFFIFLLYGIPKGPRFPINSEGSVYNNCSFIYLIDSLRFPDSFPKRPPHCPQRCTDSLLSIIKQKGISYFLILVDCIHPCFKLIPPLNVSLIFPYLSLAFPDFLDFPRVSSPCDAMPSLRQ